MTHAEVFLSRLPLDQLDVRWEASPVNFDVSQVRRGLIFIAAAWSGYPIMVMRTLGEILPSVIGRHVPVHVLDHDEFAPEYWEEKGVELLPEGWGEMIWIKEGEPMQIMKRYSPQDRERIAEYSGTLLF